MSYWQNRKVLVTGGAGMIGSCLVEKLVAEGADVYVADNFQRGTRENLYGADGRPLLDRDRILEVDLKDQASARVVVNGMDTVFHLADIVAGVKWAEEHQARLLRENTLIDFNVLDAAVKARTPSGVIYVSSACAYAMDQQQIGADPFVEEQLWDGRPHTVYGIGKLVSGEAFRLADRGQKDGTLDTGIVLLHNAYGPKTDMNPLTSQVIPALCRKAIESKEGGELVVWGSGNQRRAFLYVTDVVDGLLAMAENGLGKGIIQIGPSESTSIGGLADMIVTISGKDLKVRYDTTKPEGDADRAADWSKARDVLGWEPRVALNDGLRQTYEWCEKYLRTHPIDLG